jgi:hypothetical protein
LKKILVLFLVLFLLTPEPAPAQRRRRSPQRQKTTKPAQPAADAAAKAERTAMANRVSAQIKSLSQFLYIYGGVVKGIEAADKAAQEQSAPAQAVAQTDRTKASVKESIRNVRAGLEQLETDLSGKPALRPFYHRFIGLSDLALSAERQADANQFDLAGRTLLRVIDKLSDGLAAMQVSGQ